MVRTLTIATLAAALLVPATATAASPSSLQTAMNALVARKTGPPGVIALVRRGRHVTVTRAGYGNLKTRRPMVATDRMRLASTAKAFSGAVVLKLVARKDLKLSDPIGKWIPTLPAAWHRVTVGEALHHTSGLPDYSQSPPFVAILQKDPHHVFDPQTLWTYVADEPLGFAPGSAYKYSNTDNVIAALVAEAATRRSYSSLLRGFVTEPFGLHRTTLPLTARLTAPYIHGYQVAAGKQPQDISTAIGASGAWASGGIVSTPSDLQHFATAYVGDEIFPRSVQRQQMRWVTGTSEPPGPGTNSAGLAIFRYRTRCGTVYGHTGNFPGYTQFFAATTDRRRAVTVSINTVATQNGNVATWRALRAIEEQAVCAAFGRSGSAFTGRR